MKGIKTALWNFIRTINLSPFRRRRLHNSGNRHSTRGNSRRKNSSASLDFHSNSNGIWHPRLWRCSTFSSDLPFHSKHAERRRIPWKKHTEDPISETSLLTPRLKGRKVSDGSCRFARKQMSNGVNDNWQNAKTTSPSAEPKVAVKVTCANQQQPSRLPKETRARFFRTNSWGSKTFRFSFLRTGSSWGPF